MNYPSKLTAKPTAWGMEISHKFQYGSDDIQERTMKLTVEEWNLIARLDKQAREDFIALKREALMIWGSAGREEFQKLWDEFAPTSERVHSHGGGYWDKTLTPTYQGVRAGLRRMHYPGGFIRDLKRKYSIYDSKVPRLCKIELEAAVEAGELCHVWHVRCTCG